MSRLAPVFAVAAALWAVASPARAQQIDQRIDITVDRGWITVTSRLEIEPDERSLALPVRIEGLTATGLTLGTRSSQQLELPSALAPEAPAAALYWTSDMEGRLELSERVPDRAFVVETRAEGAMRYWDGQYEVVLDALGFEGHPPQVTFHVVHAGDQLHWHGSPIVPGEPLTWDLGETVTEPSDALRLTPSSVPSFEGDLATLDLGDRTLASLELRAGPQLAQVPREAQIVVVIDTSRSVAPPVLSGSLAAARAYLDAFVDKGARVQVVTFDRQARTLLDDFLPAAQAIEALEKAAPKQHNGSALPEAVALAASQLAERPRGKPRRLLVLGDLELAPHTGLAALAESFERSGALVHIAEVVGGPPQLEVIDHPELSPVVEATGGLVWRATITGHADYADGMREHLARWASPRVLRDLRLRGAEGIPRTYEQLELGRHDQLRWISTKAPRRVRISGRLWTKAVQVDVRPSPALRRRLALQTLQEHADRFEQPDGAEQEDEPTLEELRALALRYGAVTPVTARRVGKGGGRVTAEPAMTLEYVPRILCRLRIDGRSTPAGLVRLRFDEDAFLHDEVEQVARRCTVGGAGVEVDIDTTVGEIVGVSSPAFVHHVEPDAAQCVEDGIWAIEFPPGHGPSARHEIRIPAVELSTRL